MKTNNTSTPNFPGFSALNYTPAPDEFYDKVAPFLKEAELKAMLYIIRRTFGFKKQCDKISLRQMLSGIVTKKGERLDYGVGVKKNALLKALTSLESKGYIIRSRNQSLRRGNESTTYSLSIANPTPLGIQKIPRARYPKDTRHKQETVQQETVINSNRKNVEFEKKGEKRGGSLKDILAAKKAELKKQSTTPVKEVTVSLEQMMPPGVEVIHFRQKSTDYKLLQPHTANTKLEAVADEISRKIGDTKHLRENRKQIKNIFALVEVRMSEADFIDFLYGVRGNTVEVINKLDRPGAFYFSEVRKRLGIEKSKSP